MSSESFFNEVGTLERANSDFGRSIAMFEKIRKRAEGSVTSDDEQKYVKDIDRHVYETNKLVNTIRQRIKGLQRGNNQSLPDYAIRKTQISALSRTFMNHLQNYQRVQLAFQKTQQNKIERQYRIVNPHASREEIRQALDEQNNGPVFQQGLIGVRTSEARRIQHDVEERHKQIVRMAQSIEQLQQMFLDMELLTERQDHRIDMVVSQVDDSKRNLESATTQMTQAVRHKRQANKKRCYIILCIILLLIIIALVLMFTVFKDLIFTKK